MKTYLTAVGFGGGVFSQSRCNENIYGRMGRVQKAALYPHGNHRVLWPTGNPQLPFSQNSYIHSTSCEEHLCRAWPHDGCSRCNGDQYRWVSSFSAVKQSNRKDGQDKQKLFHISSSCNGNREEFEMNNKRNRYPLEKVFKDDFTEEVTFRPSLTEEQQ